MRACKIHSHSHSHSHKAVVWASQAPVALERRRVRCAAQASSSKGSDEEKLKVALGIEAPKPDLDRPALGYPPLDLLLDRVESLSAALSEVTENDNFQVGGGQIVLLFFPIWLLYVLVAAKAIELPFPLPFLDN